MVCGVDVRGARPVAQRLRKTTPRYLEKVADSIKATLAAQIIRFLKSPWASSVVVIIKNNGVDIRLCIDYRAVNGLT
ncbi:hypothetical protein PC129_g21642 [Phytophthora cactorum]|uniref:Reverse transcriptase n=1 Tax=Phytophthora cactorum TaxID=29920 RepID=A0A329RGU0_9STRA|nr:hypothetical protein Pcac1_g764 [Phytophthora cactorum]KAG2796321.1 hypothetical protein PC112_g22258 [Phytophthora cactorum]KAG2799323.1 hypothetical protein PC111_g20478 [Phytophthora cactorum]KAG2841809.1 hypothetical protein PC113_g18953 [Phytophthora cactorum]KAG2875374.1 hypothetical protein PC114_g24759 [Phytophthora cactorum]